MGEVRSGTLGSMVHCGWRSAPVVLSSFSLSSPPSPWVLMSKGCQSRRRCGTVDGGLAVACQPGLWRELCCSAACCSIIQTPPKPSPIMMCWGSTTYLSQGGKVCWYCVYELPALPDTVRLVQTANPIPLTPTDSFFLIVIAPSSTTFFFGTNSLGISDGATRTSRGGSFI